MSDARSMIANLSVRSDFADDADFRELLRLFVGSLTEKAALLRSLQLQGNVDEIRILAHQVKGAAGGYGFPGLSAAAAQLEQACRTGSAEPIARTLREFLEYAGRIEI
jgi:HPt (histidine-containing phosphotransfer) domain-containing protein